MSESDSQATRKSVPSEATVGVRYSTAVPASLETQTLAPPGPPRAQPPPAEPPPPPALPPVPPPPPSPPPPAEPPSQRSGCASQYSPSTRSKSQEHKDSTNVAAIDLSTRLAYAFR